MNATSMLARELHEKINGTIDELVAANNRFGIGALTFEQVEKNLETIRQLKALMAHIDLFKELRLRDEL